MNVICYGDSNTYGYDPRSSLGGRYDAGSRWVDLLAAKTNWTVTNFGQNGWEIPLTAPAFPAEMEALIVMLGTNDLLQGRSPAEAAGRLERFLSGVVLDRSRILLIAPPPMACGEWVTSQQLILDSRTFARCCETLAGQLGIPFADAAAWNVSLAHDGVHFTEPGHRAFADGLWKALPGTGLASP